MLTLSACSGNSKNEAIQLYTKVNEAANNAKSCEADMTMDMSMDALGETMSIKMSGNTKQVIRSQTDIDMYMDMNMDMFGQSANVSYFYKEGFIYMDVMGMKIKTPTGLEEAVAQAGNLNLDIKEDIVKKSEVKDEGENKVLSFELDAEKTSKALLDAMGAMQQSLDALGDTEIKFSNVQYTAVVDKDENLVSEIMIADMTMKVDGQEINAKYNITVENIKYNTVEAIDFPADLDTYSEVQVPAA